MWKANHDNQVALKAMLMERPDLGDRASRIAELIRERDEARKELSPIHRWIERNHADGFIDSLTYFQNLERVTDSWYDRLDRLEVDTGRFEKKQLNEGSQK
jgi:hypothetical protein